MLYILSLPKKKKKGKEKGKEKRKKKKKNVLFRYVQIPKTIVPRHIACPLHFIEEDVCKHKVSLVTCLLLIRLK